MTLEHRHHARCACGSSLSSYAAAPRPFVFAGTKRVCERSRPFAIRHIALDPELQIVAKAIAGSATLDIARIDPAAAETTLDAVGFELRDVQLRSDTSAAWAAAPHAYDGQELRVTVPAGVEAFDSLRCPRCAECMRVISTILEVAVIEKILTSLRKSTEPMPRARARDPTGQQRFEFDAA